MHFPRGADYLLHLTQSLHSFWGFSCPLSREKKGSRSVSPLDVKDVLTKLQQRIAHDHSIRDPARTAG